MFLVCWFSSEILHVLVIIWMHLHPRAYRLFTNSHKVESWWCLGSADQNCIRFRVREGIPFVLGNRMLVATGQWSKFDVPPKLGPFLVFRICEYSLGIWSCPFWGRVGKSFGEGYTDPLVIRAYRYFLPIGTPFLGQAHVHVVLFVNGGL